MTEPARYSISVRVRRVTVEEGYVKVPVDASVMNPTPETDGTYRLDGDKVMAEATRMASDRMGRRGAERVYPPHSEGT